MWPASASALQGRRAGERSACRGGRGAGGGQSGTAIASRPAPRPHGLLSLSSAPPPPKPSRPPRCAGEPSPEPLRTLLDWGEHLSSITMLRTASLDGAGPAGLGCPACLWPCWGAGGARLGRLVCRAPACRPLGAPPHATRGPCVRRSRGRVGVGHLPRASRPGAGGKDAQVQVPHYGGCSDRRGESERNGLLA